MGTLCWHNLTRLSGYLSHQLIYRLRIDAYLETYISLAGDHRARTRLYKEILAQAATRDDTLDVRLWTVKVVQKRLQNALAIKNRTESSD